MGQIPRDIMERLGYFHREVDDLFRRLFVDELSASTLPHQSSFPSIDVVEDEAAILVRADLPGVLKADIELFGAPNFLIIRGTKKAPAERLNYLRVERSFGAFQRLVALPVAGDAARITARYDNGVLDILIPKLVDRRLRHRQIPIE